MSHISNTAFFERCAEFIDEHEGMSYIPRHAEKLLDEQNYEELERFMRKVEADLSREHFRGQEVY